LAEAGLDRLGLSSVITEVLPKELCIPGAGQGAVGVECLSENTELCELVAKLTHKDTSDCVIAERSMNARLDGNCHSPIGSFAYLDGNNITLEGFVGNIKEKTTFNAKSSMDRKNNQKH
jgi:hydroxymethylbilane synthase